MRPGRPARTCAAWVTCAARDRSSRSTTTCRSRRGSSCTRGRGMASCPARRAPVRWKRTGEDPRDRGGRPVRRHARGRLEPGAPARGLGPHARRGRDRGGSGRVRQRVHQRRPRPRRARPARAALSRSVGHRTRADVRDPPPEQLLAGSRRDADPRDQRHRHRPVGPVRPGHRPTGRAPARRAVPGSGAAVRLDPDARTGSAGRGARPVARPGLPRVQARLGPVRPGERPAGRVDRRARTRGRRAGRRAHGRCRRQRRVLAERLQLGGPDRRDARRARRRLVRGAARARRHRRLSTPVRARPACRSRAARS